jgi:hypothetical protein
VVAYAENDCGRTPDEECQVTITCLPEPCVEVTCEAPAAACDGDEITVSGTATNCSGGPEDITITINGPGGPIGSMLFEDVPAGENRTHSETFAHSCTPVQPTITSDGEGAGEALAPDPVSYYASAVAENSCDQVSAMSDPCMVECSPEPCVTVECEAPQASCDGDEITVSGTATNCSEGPENITITINGPGGVIGSMLFASVPTGESRTHSETFDHNCEPDQVVEYSASALAVNGCGETSDESEACPVDCKPEPCLELVCEGPADACDGDEVTVSGTATNCSAGAEDITITISGPGGQLATQTFAAVPAGESRTSRAPRPVSRSATTSSPMR